MDIELLKSMIANGNIKWSTHCLERMQERDIKRSEVKSVIMNGEIIEDYPDDFPHPSCLVFGLLTDNRVLHVVAGTNGYEIFIITAYIPNTIKFEEDLKTRRR